MANSDTGHLGRFLVVSFLALQSLKCLVNPTYQHVPPLHDPRFCDRMVVASVWHLFGSHHFSH